MKRKITIVLTVILIVSGLGGFVTFEKETLVKATSSPQKPTRYTVLVLDNSKGGRFLSNDDKLIYDAPMVLPYIKKSATEFLNNLFQGRSNEYVAIVTFEDRAYKVSDFSNNLSKLRTAVNNISPPRSKGNLSSGIELASNLLSKVKGNVNKNAVIMTTGDTMEGEYSYSGRYSSNTVGSQWYNTKTKVNLYAYANIAYEKACKLKEQANVYSVGMFQIFDDMPDAGGDVVQLYQLVAKDLASEGKYFEAKNLDLLSESMGKVFNEFANQSFKVNVTPEDDVKGTIVGAQTYKIGDLATLTATPKEGWEFAGWYEGKKCVSKQNPYTFYPSRDINLVAKFKRPDVNAIGTTANSIYGTVKVPERAELESVVTYKAIPKAGYKFVGWYKDTELVSTENPYRFTITGDTNLKAVFEWDNSLDDNGLAESVIASELPILLVKGKGENNQVTLSYTGVPKAEQYEVYYSVCDGNEYYTKIAESSNMNLIQSKLNPKKAYKYFVSAYRYKNGAKEYIAKSPVIHVAMKNYKGTNVKSISASKKNITLGKGKKTKIYATYKKENRKKPLVSHAPKYRYITSNKKVATVSPNGQVTGVGKGKCSVYVVANNGVWQKIKVTVK